MTRDSTSKGSRSIKTEKFGGEMVLFVGRARLQRCDCGQGHNVAAERYAQSGLCKRAEVNHLLTQRRGVAWRDSKRWGARVENRCGAAPVGMVHFCVEFKVNITTELLYCTRAVAYKLQLLWASSRRTLYWNIE